MGQTQNSCEKIKEPIIKVHGHKSEAELNDDSSYKGLKSECDSIDNSNATNESTPTSLSAEENSDFEVVSETVITWKEGGREVFVAGSFSDWKQWFALKKEGDLHVLKILLPKGKHNIKFIVDKCWVCSSYYETVLDEKGNLNNVINNTSEKDKSRLKDVQPGKSRIKEKKTRAISDASQNCYSDIKPDRDLLNLNTPSLPCAYKPNFALSKSQFQHERLKSKSLILQSTEMNFVCTDTLNYSSCNNLTSTVSLSTHANL